MNAPRPLRITSYDGSGENVHPDVVDSVDGFGGFRYWMACTPYPRANDRLENPSIRASHDGYRWEEVPGCPDPLVLPPDDPDSHHADPDLVLDGGLLHLFFMTTTKSRRTTAYSWMYSDDGRTWSDPAEVYRSVWGVSPAVVVMNGTWFMWYVHLDTSTPDNEAELRVRVGEGPDRWHDEEVCTLEIDGHVPWHIDVRSVGDHVEALIAAFPRGSDSSHTRLFAATSSDMRRFELLVRDPVLRPSRLGWDGRFIYRSTFVVDQDWRYRVWYTGGSWDRRHGIGYVEGPIDALRSVDVGGLGRVERLDWLGRSILGYSRFALRRLLPDSLVASMRSAADALRTRSR